MNFRNWCFYLILIATFSTSDSTATTYSFLKPDRQNLPFWQDTTVYMVVEKYPVFPGGEAAMWAHINSSGKYPASKIKTKNAKLLAVRILVEKDGSISNVKFLKSEVDEKIKTDTRNLFMKMAKWSPGLQGGRPLRTHLIIPMYFTI